MRISKLIVFLALLVPLGSWAFTDGADRSLTRLGEYGEWTLANPSYGGNPFDVIANATFVHSDSGERRTTPLFYAGSNQWKLRFTATRLGRWTFTTVSGDPELNGFSGTVIVNGNSPYKGFVQASASNWVRSATGEAFAPQFVMYAGPHYFRSNIGLIRSDISRYLTTHGFTGLHVPVYCRWFDINQASCANVANSNPDLDTFNALETLIREVYYAGGTVHLWAWGDSGRQQNPTLLSSEGGINGPADLRLQRYIAGRLGPLPGWTMGYGYDLFEWVGGGELSFWRNHMHNLMGWAHLLGARGSTNSFAQPSEVMDYAAYETHKPSYPTYRITASQRSNKPSFSEDRFRYRGSSQRTKDYTFEEMRRGMWHSAMAGGVANIWGNSTDANGVTYDSGINGGERPSNAFPNADALRTYRQFMDSYFERGMLNCDGDTDAICARRADGTARNLYREDTSRVQIDLSGHSGSLDVIAVDTRRAWAAVSLGAQARGNVQIDLPYMSDWALRIGSGNGTTTPSPPPPEPTPPPPVAGPEPGLDTMPPSIVRNLRVE